MMWQFERDQNYRICVDCHQPFVPYSMHPSRVLGDNSGRLLPPVPPPQNYQCLTCRSKVVA